MSAGTIKNDAKLAKAFEAVQTAEPELPRKEAIAKAKEVVKEEKKAKTETKANEPKPEPTVEEILTNRWGKCIKDIPVTNHAKVRLWLTEKLKQSAL